MVDNDFLILIYDKIMRVDLVELILKDINIIFGIYRLHKCYTFLDCHSRVVRYHFPNEIELL